MKVSKPNSILISNRAYLFSAIQLLKCIIGGEDFGIDIKDFVNSKRILLQMLEKINRKIDEIEED